MPLPFVSLGELASPGLADSTSSREADEATLLARLASAGLVVLEGLVVRLGAPAAGERAGSSGDRAPLTAHPRVDDESVRAALGRLAASVPGGVLLVSTAGDASSSRAIHGGTALAGLRSFGADTLLLVRPVPEAEATGHVTSCDPLTGADEVVITAGWGVQAMTGGGASIDDADGSSPSRQRPDVVVLDAGDRVVQRSTGHKTSALRPSESSLVVGEVNVFRRAAEVVDDARAAELAALARAAAATLGVDVRLGWALVDGLVLVVGVEVLPER